MKSLYYYPMLALVLFLFSCGGGDGDDPEQPDPVPAPVAAVLIFPEDNTECNEGTLLSESQSSVVFRWNASENTDSYRLKLRNLNANTNRELNASTNELEVTLDRGVPYSWSIESLANGTDETTESDTWQFYNAGPAIENYAPFPAENITPRPGATVNPGTLTLQWEGNDLDDDTLSYVVYFDTVNPPTTSVGETTESSINVDTVTETIYYWRVETQDAAGNSSLSEAFQFKTN
ncbi:MAG: hypothetical protein AAFX53_00385 [Bacteroidota bacterium]